MEILSFLPLTLYLLSCFPFISSLSTVAISETSNQTVICALVHSSPGQSHLNCTSSSGAIQNTIRSSRSFSGIVAGDGFVCVLRSFYSSSTAAMGCWRFSNNSIPYKRIYRGPLLKELEAGNSHICGLINGTNKLQCWKWRGFDSSKSSDNNNNFSSLAVGEDFVCGLSSEFGNIKCLQKQNNDVIIVPELGGGNFSVVESGFRRTCAIFSLNSSLQCWEREEPPRGEFTSLALGENRSCAVRTNRTVTCWGESNNFSLPEALRTIEFISIEAKRSIFCGVLYNNYSLFCWGNQILDSNPMVFENVVPGPCKSTCPCPLSNFDNYCSHGLMICQPCASSSGAGETPPPPPLPPPPPPPPPPHPPPPPPPQRCGVWNKKTVAFVVVGSVGSLSMVMVCCFLFFRYCKIRGCRVHDSGRLDEEGTPHSQPPPQPQPQPPATTATPVLEKRLSQLLSLENGGRLEEFSLQTLHQSTDTFSDHHKIGKGSFGSVYRATLDDGREVAIKRAEASTSSAQVMGKLWTKRQEDDKDTAFLNELESLSRLNHKNLVRLFGYCEDSNERILVYEYMNNGTLHDHLHHLKSSPLMSWAGRIKVALDAAKGIQYLHEYAVPPIIHRDIKSSNILLDSNWTAKVSDFGLSLMGPPEEESYLSLGAAGTVGYMDPEYYRLQQLSTKSDVYSFGVVLLELLSGYRAIHQNENGVPRNVVDLVVPHIVRDQIHRVLDKNVAPPNPFEIEAVAYVGYIAADCVALEGRDRPTMSEIVNSLERALAACLAAPPPQTGSSEENSSIL